MKRVHNNLGCVVINDSRVHMYADRRCAKCGTVFCFTCCASTNVHEGGKHEPDYMLCPVCEQDWYIKEIS